MTPNQSRAARGLLALSQRDLATKSGIATSTISLFESERCRTLPVIVGVLRRSLEDAGVTFLGADETAGPGVRLRQAAKP